MLRQNSGMSYRQENKETICINMCAHLLKDSPLPHNFHSFRILYMETLQTLVHSATTDNEETLYQRRSDASQTIRSCRGILESVRQSMIRRVHARIDSRGGHFDHLF
jgi:hypothetical protein